MIYNPSDLKVAVIQHFMPLSSEVGPNAVMSPRVIRSRHILYSINEGWLFGHGVQFDKVNDYQRRVKEATIPQPCSVDISLDEFTDEEGRPLNYPFVLQPNGLVIGRSHLSYYDVKGGGQIQGDYYVPNSIICVETRSSIARKGLACVGFYTGSREPSVFLRDQGKLNFILRNYSPIPLVVTKPFSPVQISVTKEVESVFDSPVPIRLVRNGRDVTEENLVRIGKFVAYKVHLAEEAAYLRRKSEPINITGNDFERIIERVPVTELHRLNPDFCLTLTEEEVHTNGCPAYIFPFHYLNATENPSNLENISLLGEFFQELFSDSRYLPVTANAGLINPGTRGKVVCENVTKGRDLEKYFKPHEPFALVIPVPFADGSTDNDTYNGTHHNQQSITFLN